MTPGGAPRPPAIPRSPARAPYLLALLLGLATGTRAAADESHHTFWTVQGSHNTVFLLGSVHVLKPNDDELPAEALRAYGNSHALVMEIDLNRLPADKLFGADPGLQQLPRNQTLGQVLGPETYRAFTERVKSLGLDPGVFTHFQPWVAAMALQQAKLSQQGFDAGSGVDEQFAQRAAADHKPIIALETVDEQLGIFAHLPMEQQRRFLRYVLDDTDDSADSADAVVAAWRDGDVQQLQSLLSQSFKEYPELFELLTTDRNRRWLPVVAALLNQDQNYLVIVGALHLVGPDGLVQLLRRQGYGVTQH
jgi:uncharacterized protein YbaP (TraB family)